MALTTELANPNSPLTAWCAATFARTPAVVEQLAAAVRDVQPVRPSGRASGRHWAEIGAAFGQRLADLVQPAPPYYALLGMIRAQWVGWSWAHQQAGQYPSHRDLPDDYRRRALNLRPAATTWLDLGSPAEPAPLEPPSAAAQTWAELLDRTRTYLATHAPTGTFGTSGAEAGLARSAWLLSACEDIYRSGGIDDRLARAFDGGRRPAVEQLRGLVDEHQVAELVALAQQLHTTGALWDLRKLAGNPAPGQPLGIAGPTIVPGWADGDLLLGELDLDTGAVGEAGTTLVDVKTVLSVRDTAKAGRWLWQVLLYAWLDTADLYRIRRVGLLLARHGILVTWSVPQLVEQLLGRGDIGERHQDAARAIAGRLITRDGLPWPMA